MYKHNRGILPNILFMKYTPSRKYNIRQHIAFKIPHFKPNTRQNTLGYVGPKLLNTIIMKNRTEDCMSMNIFKMAVKQYILRIY